MVSCCICYVSVGKAMVTCIVTYVVTCMVTCQNTVLHLKKSDLQYTHQFQSCINITNKRKQVYKHVVFITFVD